MIAGDRVQKQPRVVFVHRFLGQRDVGEVHRVAGLEGDYPFPVVALEFGLQPFGSMAVFPVVDVADAGYGLQPSGDVNRMGRFVEIRDARVRAVLRRVDKLRFAREVRFPDVFQGQYGFREI